MTHPLYRTSAWRKASKQTLYRDGYWCQIRLPKCRGVATTADHIVDHEDGGEPYSLENLRAACVSCQASQRNRRVAARARAKRADRGPNPLQKW